MAVKQIMTTGVTGRADAPTSAVAAVPAAAPDRRRARSHAKASRRSG